jgi:hypothetical protein
MDWKDAVEKLAPYVFKIHTPSGTGTGFLCLFNDDKTLCGIATALHVVQDSEEWQQPIRLVHHQSNESLFLKEDERIIYLNGETDSAIILFRKPEFEIQKNL